MAEFFGRGALLLCKFAMASVRASIAEVAVFHGTETVALDSLSIAEDSGWRQLDEERVKELEAAFLEGGYGSTTLAGPSIVYDQGNPLVASDGGSVIYNGKHCIAALKRVREKWLALAGSSAPVGSAALALVGSPAEDGSTAEAGSSAPDWLTGQLLSVFEKGLLVTKYNFTESYDNLRHQSMQALAHEEDSNKMLHTTLEQKARVANAYFERCGRDWAAAQRRWCKGWGKRKRAPSFGGSPWPATLAGRFCSM